jgi:hypothetical protein
VAKAAPPRGRLNNFLRQGALQKGLLGGSPGWRALFVVMFGARMMRKLFGKTEEIVFTEKLKPGHLLQIEAIKPLSRRARKAIKRSPRRARG